MKKYQWIVGAMLALSLSSPTQSFAQTKTQYQSNRPAVDDRHFTSEAIEKIIAEVKEAIKEKENKNENKVIFSAGRAVGYYGNNLVCRAFGQYKYCRGY